MKRQSFKARDNFEKRNAEVGFDFGKVGKQTEYWNETTGYGLSSKEVDQLEAATAELFKMTMDTVGDLVYDDQFLDRLQVSPDFRKWLRRSWDNPASEYSLYGRFDFFFDGSEIKLYEYNADTPTSLLESSLVQYYWMKDRNLPDQFNSIHEKLIDTWKYIKTEQLGRDTLYCSSLSENQEDYRTVEYIMDTAHQAGLQTKFITIDDLGTAEGDLYDLQERKISAMFKLYPWEWMVDEDFADSLLTCGVKWFEPPWKMVLSNKALLVELWKRYPKHELLLPAHYEAGTGQDLVRKPVWSREGANITLPGMPETAGESGAPYVYQAYKPLPNFDGWYPMFGSWVIGDAPAGLGIREDESKVTGNLSRFTPHWFE